jgi:hypothetical protein
MDLLPDGQGRDGRGLAAGALSTG